MTAVLAVRLDSAGDVLLTGPAVRAVAAGADRVDVLASPLGADAARLLPGVHRVLVHDPAWNGPHPPPLRQDATLALVEQLRAGSYDEAVVFTSYHQSPLPAAMVCRLAGIPRVSGTSDDYPGSLLDVRHRRHPDGRDDDGGPDGGHEVEAALRLAAAAGYPLPADDDALLAVRPTRSRRPAGLHPPYVVVHPSSAAPSRSVPTDLARGVVTELARRGVRTVVTGGPGDTEVGRTVSGVDALDLSGRTDLAGLAAVLRDADVLVAGNSGPAHLAAAVGTPVVSVFAPVVPAQRWRPWGVPVEVLGDQSAPCAMSRARECPVPGHPCLATVTPAHVADAVDRLAARRSSRCAS